LISPAEEGSDEVTGGRARRDGGDARSALAAAEEKLERIARYEETYESSYGFEGVMVSARRRLILEILGSSAHDVVVEVGCGSDLLVDSAATAGLTWSRWVIVEPGQRFASLAERAADRHAGVTVLNTFVEDAVEQVKRFTDQGADIVLCSGVLHGVDDDRAVLEAVHELLSKSGRLHVNVPNAASLHRRLARVMGLIADEHQLTARNRALDQHRLYDVNSLVQVVRSVGFTVEETGGYALKPFTHAQMDTLEFVTDDLLTGLYELGRELPDLAAEIYLNASLGP
jgi:2-polyprenyl-3-methyl-5-hydroxy-6-metoxy-1,4-benzoquinol methylase